MSYNYLPLDRKWLHFQQVKNLLDYNQLVSITFDAHERILKCRDYLDNISNHKNKQIQQNEQAQNHLLSSRAVVTGEELPADIVKLMLMLKIKSLSYGHSGVQIETVKRLMEMYNNEVLPVVYTLGVSGAVGDACPLSQLILPLIGLGEVYFKGQKKASSLVLNELDRQPLILQTFEGEVLTTGTHFMSAYGMYALKKTEQLLKFADAVAALSFDASGCSVESLHGKIHSIRSHKGQANTAAIILKYLDGSDTAPEKKPTFGDAYSFDCTPSIHGAAKDTFDYVLNVLLKEINSVTESPAIFPDEDLILSGGNFNTQPLALALDFLAIAMNKVGSISERRTNQLISGQKNSQLLAPGFNSLQSVAATITSENRHLSAPASLDNISGANNYEDFISMGANATTKCMRVINNIEKNLAIELMTAAQVWELEKTNETSPFLKDFVTDFREQVSFADKYRVLHDDITKAIDFIQTYKF